MHTVQYCTALVSYLLCSPLRVGLYTFEDPDFELFRWCILQNRLQLAFVFWEQTKVKLKLLLASLTISSACGEC